MQTAEKNFIPYINAQSLKEILDQSRSNFFSSFRLLKKEKREALLAVYAFFRIMDDCVDEISDHDQQKEAIAFWKSELEKIYHSQAHHPVMRELSIIIQRYKIPEEYFLGLIEGCEMDVNVREYQSFDELYEYCYRVAGLVGLVCMKIFEYESETSEETAIQLGLAFQLTNILRDVGEDLERGRLYLPKEDLEKHGCVVESLKQHQMTPAFLSFLFDYAERAEQYYKKAYQEFQKDKEGKLVVAQAMAKVYHQILKKLKKEKFPVFEKKTSLNFFEKVMMFLPFIFKRQI